jgi:predicted Zn finger-like uncharacterized protein
MFTQCPECRTVHNVKAKQLRKNRGIFRCKNCAAQFDALQLISEKAPKIKSQQSFFPPSQPLWEEPKTATPNAYWSAGVVAVLGLLATQFFYFEQRHLEQNPALRPWLEKLCATLHCRLPAYRNSGELAILQSVLQLRADQNYRLQAALANKSGFAQAYPQLKLSLLDFNGDSFAARLFTPQEYLPQPPDVLFSAGATVEIGLDIAVPEVPVGGYLIELL